MATKTTKALSFLKKSKTVKARAEQYAPRISQSLKIKMLVPLEEEINKITDKIFDLEDFSLSTDHNKGQQRMTIEDCQARFEEIINLTYRKEALILELEVKQEAFDNLFGE